jgi:hypothetical protein
VRFVGLFLFITENARSKKQNKKKNCIFLESTCGSLITVHPFEKYLPVITGSSRTVLRQIVMHFIISDEPLEDWHCSRCLLIEVIAIPGEEPPGTHWICQNAVSDAKISIPTEISTYFWAAAVQPLTWSLY